MKFFLYTLFLLLSLCVLSGCEEQNTAKIKIGIIVPIEHRAMDEIVSGFTHTLSDLYHQPVSIKIANAEGDANMQRAIILQMRDQNYNLIVPIGLTATQMAQAMLKAQPILSLATDFSEKERRKLRPCNMAIVNDEISPPQIIAFIHAVYPQITQLTLIHSASEKIMPEVDETIAVGKKYGINIHHLMVSSLPELYTAAQAIPKDTQGIFILKDNLIASGISSLAKTATLRHIPLITSDQGSVQNGAGFALGVHEREIGVEGAKLATAILAQKKICDLPIAVMKNLTVFINPTALQQSVQSNLPIINTAKHFGYPVENVER